MTMLAQGKRPESFTTVEEAVEYYKQLYTADILDQNLKTKTTNTKQKKEQTKTGRPRKKQRTLCPHCKKFGVHTPEECRENPKNKHKQKGHNEHTGKKPGLKEAFAIIERAQKKARGKKRVAKATTDEDDDLDAFLANLQQNMNLSDDENLSDE